MILPPPHQISSQPDAVVDIFEGYDAIFDNITSSLIGFSENDIYDFYKSNVFHFRVEYQSLWNNFYKRDVIDKNKVKFIKGLYLVEDRIFNAMFFAYAQRVVVTSKKYYYYIQRESGLLKSSGKISPVNICSAKKQAMLAREMVNELYLSMLNVDISHSYRGSNIIACFEQCIRLSQLPSIKTGYKYYNEFISSPAIQRDIKKISIAGAPLKIKIPIILLRNNMSLLLYVLVYYANKFGVSLKANTTW